MIETSSELYRRLCALPHQPGDMIYENEAIALAIAAHDRVCVEIGSWRGMSTAMLASTATYVIAVDVHNGIRDTTSPETREPPTLEGMRLTLAAAGVSHKVAIVPSVSSDAAPLVERLTDYKVGCLFIDGSHREEDVYMDLVLYTAFLRSPYYLVLDDLGYATVARAFQRWKNESNRRLSPVDLRTWGIEDPIHNRLHEGAVSKCTFFRVMR